MFADSSGEQLFHILLCAGFGMLAGLSADIVWWLTPCRTPRWALIVRDSLLAITGFIALFLLSLSLTSGRLRLYLFFGVGGGLAVYEVTLHRVLNAAQKRVRRCAMRLITALRTVEQKLFLSPLRRWIIAPLQKRRKPARKNKQVAFFSNAEKNSRSWIIFLKKLLKSVPHLLYNDHK